MNKRDDLSSISIRTYELRAAKRYSKDRKDEGWDWEVDSGEKKHGNVCGPITSSQRRLEGITCATLSDDVMESPLAERAIQQLTP